MQRTYFTEFTFDFWEILYTEGDAKDVFHTGEGSNDSRMVAIARLRHLIAARQLPEGLMISV